MNFSQEIKRDIIRSAPEKRCCMAALLSGVLDACGTVDEEGFSFTIESEETAGFLINEAARLLGAEIGLKGATLDPKQRRDKLTFFCGGEQGRALMRELVVHASKEELPECCVEGYLKGAFLGGGSCTLPRKGTKTGYHLETVFEREADALEFCGLLERRQLIGSVIRRNERYVVYLKSREAISDFLSVVGAESALKRLEAVSAEREERNRENRQSNCYAGNADKAATASAEQALVLGRLRAEGRLSLLPQSLFEAARARLDNPELSLSELAEKLSLTKSCLNHRLRRVMELARRQDGGNQ